LFKYYIENFNKLFFKIETFLDDTNPFDQDKQRVLNDLTNKGNKILIRKNTRNEHDQIIEEDEDDYIEINDDKKIRKNSINTNYESFNDKNDKDIDKNFDNEENNDNKDRFKINLNYKEIIRSKSGMINYS
jgi:hypothetical protein